MRLGYLNANSQRDYPLTGPATITVSGIPHKLPTDVLVESAFVVATDTIADAVAELIEVRRQDRDLLLLLSVGGTNLEFSHNLDAEFTTTFVQGPDSVSSCGDHPRVFGFLTTGYLAALAAILPDGAVGQVTDAVVEPACIAPLASGGITSISVANTPRTTVVTPQRCRSSSSSSSLGLADGVVVNSRCIVTPVVIRGGYNCFIRQDSENQRITVGAGLGVGAGAVCNEIPLSDEEAAVSEGTLLTGGPRCADVITTINGAVGPNIALVGSGGIRVFVDPVNPHKLIVEAAFRGTSVSPETGNEIEVG